MKEYTYQAFNKESLTKEIFTRFFDGDPLDYQIEFIGVNRSKNIEYYIKYENSFYYVITKLKNEEEFLPSLERHYFKDLNTLSNYLNTLQLLEEIEND